MQVFAIRNIEAIKCLLGNGVDHVDDEGSELSFGLNVVHSLLHTPPKHLLNHSPYILNAVEPT